MTLGEQIEQLRALLNKAGTHHPLTTQEVLRISQQLDRLIVIHMRMDQQERKRVSCV